MSTFKQKKELKAQIAAAKAAGKSTQTIGRLQYKLNQLTANPKGNAVRTKSTTNKAGQTVRGSVVKTKSGGTVRTKPTVAKKRPVAKRKTPLRGSPSAGQVNTVKLTGLNGKSKVVAAGSGKLVDAKQTKLHPYTKLTNAELKRKAVAGDSRAKAILNIRLGK
jgi:hypothetical protein